MNHYVVTIFANLFTVHREIWANSRAEAAAQVSQQGARAVMVIEAEYED